MKQQTKEVAETITDEDVRDESVCRALVGLREDVEVPSTSSPSTMIVWEYDALSSLRVQ